MSAKNETEVNIGGKSITLSGYESVEYLQKVAAYINGKLADFGKSDTFRRHSPDMRNTMIQLNIADDYFKAKKIADTLEGDLESKDKEIYDLKHELIAMQIKLDNQSEEIKRLKKETAEYQKALARAES